jgi:hypothetical protein
MTTAATSRSGLPPPDFAGLIALSEDARHESSGKPQKSLGEAVAAKTLAVINGFFAG